MLSNVSLASLPSSAARARLDWQAEVGPNPSQPVVAGEEVYVGTQTVDRRSEIHRFSAETGRKLSTAHTWPGVLENQLGATAIMRSPDGQVMGINARTGERQWGFQPSSFPQAIVSDGQTLVVATEDSLSGITEQTTAPMDLTFASDLKETRSLAPGLDGGWLVHTGREVGSGQLNSLTREGNLQWSVPVPTGGPQHAPAVTPDGTVLVANVEGSVSARDGKTGDELWRFKSNQTYINRPDVGPAGQVVVSTCQGQVSQLGSDGRPLWSTDTGAPVRQTFVHPDGTVFVHHPGALEALDAKTGESVQNLSIPTGNVTQAPDGNLYALGLQGVLRKIVLE